MIQSVVAIFVVKFESKSKLIFMADNEPLATIIVFSHMPVSNHLFASSGFGSIPAALLAIAVGFADALHTTVVV